MNDPSLEDPFWRKVDRFAANNMVAVFAAFTGLCGGLAAFLDWAQNRPAAIPWLAAHHWAALAVSGLKGLFILLGLPGLIVFWLWSPGLQRDLERTDRPAVRSSVVIGSLLLLLGGIVATWLFGIFVASR